jgi:hypothetical protein
MFVGGMDWFQDARLEGFQQKENLPHVAKHHDERKEVTKLWNPPNQAPCVFFTTTILLYIIKTKLDNIVNSFQCGRFYMEHTKWSI